MITVTKGTERLFYIPEAPQAPVLNIEEMPKEIVWTQVKVIINIRTEEKRTEETHVGTIWKPSDCKWERVKGYTCCREGVAVGGPLHGQENQANCDPCGRSASKTEKIFINEIISEKVISTTPHEITVRIRALGWCPKYGVIGYMKNGEVKTRTIDCIFEYDEKRPVALKEEPACCSIQ